MSSSMRDRCVAYPQAPPKKYHPVDRIHRRSKHTFFCSRGIIMHPATWERMMQDEEYARALQMDIAREAHEAEVARRGECAPAPVERAVDETGETESDENDEASPHLTLEELRAHRLRFFQLATPTRPTARCGATTKSGRSCRRYAAAGCNGRCSAHTDQA